MTNKMAGLKAITTKINRTLLQLIFRFDGWHISPLQERKYAVDIISYCNRRITRNFFVEIGCGLGDITRAVNYSKKIGYDMDIRVLKAASKLRNTNKEFTAFLQFKFPESVLPMEIDTLVMVNWIHLIEPEILKAKLEGYLANHMKKGGEIIIDTVQDPDYQYNHQISFLMQNMNASSEKIGSYARQRDVWAIKKQ